MIRTDRGCDNADFAALHGWRRELFGSGWR